MASGSLSDALVGKHLVNINTQVASVTHSTINTNITNLGSTTRLGSINGIDTGVIAILDDAVNGTATVGAVVIARSILTNLGTEYVYAVSAGSGDPNFTNVRIILTNTTTVTADRGGAEGGSGATGTQTVYQLVEHVA